MSIPDDVAALIADAPLSAHLATSVDDRPHVAPVWYVYEGGDAYRAASDAETVRDDRLWVLTGGKKLENVRRNPRVAVSIERADESGVDWAVQLLGTARESDDDARIAAVEAAMTEIYRDGTASDGGEDADPPGEWALLGIRVGTATVQRYDE
ncbi:pyridoxamine 5'-phosphate oxidase family protein [Haloarcula marina]|uniref:pyridoxamine 5'-phosphate oxidase family protein n=1 Tax=Haloarcula marina TaxID=2961574 RepID=UPI0020B7C6D8|nr:pyridoxamine 5'-phosphate oxidase family protein [Halomicroarcula marina]